MSEIIFLAILALIVIGPKELPQLARTLGRFLNELKRSSNLLTDELKQQVRFDEFDLNEMRSRPPQEKSTQTENLESVAHDSDEQEGHHDYDHESSHHHVPQEPEQMELAEQATTESKTDSSENKKS